jgi:hypothetical protein
MDVETTLTHRPMEPLRKELPGRLLLVSPHSRGHDVFNTNLRPFSDFLRGQKAWKSHSKYGGWSNTFQLRAGHMGVVVHLDDTTREHAGTLSFGGGTKVSGGFTHITHSPMNFGWLANR